MNTDKKMKQKYALRDHKHNEVKGWDVMVGIAILTSFFLFGLNFYDIEQLQKQQIQPQEEIIIQNKIIEGLSLRGFNQSEVEEITNQYDDKGDWICVNVDEMSFKRAVEVCHHEVGHEIFAEICEKNITRCFDLIE